VPAGLRIAQNRGICVHAPYKSALNARREYSGVICAGEMEAIYGLWSAVSLPLHGRRSACGGCWPFITATAARSRRRAPAGGGGGWYGWVLFGFLVTAKVMTAHTLPPAAMPRHTVASPGPRTKARADRVHTVIAELAMTAQDNNRITILTRHAPAPPANGADSRAC
jgi:hypothetical protein